MDLFLIFVIFFIGFIGSFIAGMVGVGGSIINYPMLLYVPPLLGLAAFNAQTASGISAVQVFFATLAGVLVYRKGKYLNMPLIFFMGIPILSGSLLGSFGSKYMAEAGINIIYGILGLLAVIMMIIPKKGIDEIPYDQVKFNKWIAITLGLLVGVSAGVVGAGGAFILVPIMLVVLKIPTRITIATSLAITFLSSIGSTIGKIATGQVSYLPALILVIASLIASPLGASVGKKINTKILQLILALLILATSIKIWTDILF